MTLPEDDFSLTETELRGELARLRSSGTSQEHHRFRTELDRLINQNCMENGSGTPDFILAKYLDSCLSAFDEAVNRREKWYGREQDSRFGTPAKALLKDFGDPTREPGQTPRMIKDIPQA